jgi:D-lactate dehydrogenase (cytochrome)
VQALTVVLSSGDVLDVERGRAIAHADGYFDFEVARGRIRVPIPAYQMPDVPKLSAGYWAAPRMDLVDLFVGSEGTLGIVTEVTLRVLPSAPPSCLILVSFDSRSAALAFVRSLREQALITWRTCDPRGIDVSAIEYMDRRCLDLVRQDGIAQANGVRLPEAAEAALLVTLELPAGTSAADAFDQLGLAREPGAPDTAIVRFCAMLDAFGALDGVEIAVPGDRARHRQLCAVREAVPAAVNDRVARARRDADLRIEKTAADVIVPFARLPELLALYDDGFRRRALDAAVWGHISDGNVHPNVIPRSLEDVEAGKAAILEVGRETIRLGGAPLAEHGVGRNPVKQKLLRELYGEGGIEEMRRVKRALDPEWKLAPGVLFPR